MSAELKPCPFCGGVAEQQNCVVEAVVHCTSCYAVIRRVHARDVDTGIDESASDWNTRAPQWQPIESAPTDGTRVLLWDTANGGRAITGAWVVGSPDDHETFTHWQPLPAPPEVKP